MQNSNDFTFDIIVDALAKIAQLPIGRNPLAEAQLMRSIAIRTLHQYNNATVQQKTND